MIRNILNNKKYIGQSKHIEQRWKEHIYASKKTNNTQYLYESIRKYGVDNFEFSILEVCSLETLNDKEIFWIDYYNSMKEGYNGTTGGNQNVTFSEKHRQNLSISRQKNKEYFSKKTKKLWENKEYKEKVIKNRELAQRNAKSVILYIENEPFKTFTSIWQCSKWLLENSYGNNIESIRSNVRKHLKRNSKTFMGENIQIRYINI